MTLRTLIVLPFFLLLAGCASSSRVDGLLGQSEPPAPAPAVSAPTPLVSSQPLTAPVTDPNAAVVAGVSPGVDPSVIDPSAPTSTPSPTDPAAGTAPAVAAAQPTTPAKPAAPNSRTLSGTWAISDAGRGATCTMLLTQTPLLDLMRANPKGCQASSIAKVNAWEMRGQEIVLIEPGGRTAVRLFPKGDGTFEGAATTSGAVVTMRR